MQPVSACGFARSDGRTQIKLARSQSGKHAEKYAGGGGDQKCKCQDAAVEGDGGEGKKMFGQQQEQSTQSDRTNPEASGPAGEGEQGIFDPKLFLNLPGRGAESEPRSNLRSAPQDAD